MKTKVLHVIGGMGRGGAPSFIINNMLKTDNEHFQYDFLVRKDNCAFEDEIKKHGGKVYVVPEFPKHLIKNYIYTKKFFRRHRGEYSVVHVHANALLYVLPIRLATKMWKCKVILHSHNTKSNVPGLGLLHTFNRKYRFPSSCVKLACSQKAGEWMYGSSDFEVINNAVDTTLFKYDINKRNLIREEFGIQEDTIVIGNIGRFERAKNHMFMVDVFSKYVERNKNAILLLVGDGSLKDSVEDKVQELGLEDKVIFTGIRSDTENFYSAFDMFIMPSLFEGLPFTLIEAQTAGLPCLISENITSEVDLTDLIYRMTLDLTDFEWCMMIDKLVKPSDREVYQKQIVKMSYDTGVTAKRLEDIYVS